MVKPFLIETEASLDPISLVLHQFNTSAYLKPFWEWMLSAKPSLVWGKLLSLFFQRCSRSNPLQVKLLLLCCAIQGNWLIRHVSYFWPTLLVFESLMLFWLIVCSLFWNLQICHEFERFSTYLPDIKVAVFYGGVNVKIHKDLLKNECPHIVVGTPGRILGLARDKDLSLRNVRHFILDECDKMLESLGTLAI